MISREMKTEGWPAGARFWYKSKYSDDVVEGVIAKVETSLREGESFSIVSTKGVWYSSNQIEIEDISDVRARKLGGLGI